MRCYPDGEQLQRLCRWLVAPGWWVQGYSGPCPWLQSLSHHLAWDPSGVPSSDGCHSYGLLPRTFLCPCHRSTECSPCGGTGMFRGWEISVWFYVHSTGAYFWFCISICDIERRKKLHISIVIQLTLNWSGVPSFSCCLSCSGAPAQSW